MPVFISRLELEYYNQAFDKLFFLDTTCLIFRLSTAVKVAVIINGVLWTGLSPVVAESPKENS